MAEQTHVGKVAIVTGAGRGLGRAMARGLLAAGARVVAADIDGPVLDELRAHAEGEGTAAALLPRAADIGREENAEAIVAVALERFGRLDILVNNAGITLETARPPGSSLPEKFWQIDPADFRRVLEVNAVAPFLLTRAAVPAMLKHGWGRIVNVTTSLDTMWRKGMIPYGSSKAANEAQSSSMAIDLEGTGITLNVLVPGGPANTRMTASFGERQARTIAPAVMIEPLLWLTSSDADGVSGKRFVAALWDKALPIAQVLEICGAPIAWPQLGEQAIYPT